MQLNNYVDTSVESTESTQSVDFTLDQDSLGILFKGFSDSLYSNKEGSIVREIASNAVDANIEAGVNLPIEVELGEANFIDNIPSRIIFRDFGLGMDPDRINNIYSKYLASTKRNDNSQIGGFGIGAKSPLSYVDMFTVITRANKIEYVYLVRRGEKTPVITLLHSEPTTKSSGTEVIIDIRKGDVSKFKTAIKQQLKYFHGVKYINCGYENDYDIVNAVNFVYREGTSGVNMDIRLGIVSYPIPLSLLVKHKLYCESLPVGLKFEVGELPVTMSRESIELKPGIEDLIDKKLLKAVEELKAIGKSQDQETSNIMEYLRSNNKTASIQLTPKISLTINNIFNLKGLVFTPFKDVSFNIPNDPFFEYDHAGKLQNGKVSKVKYVSVKSCLVDMARGVNSTKLYRVNGNLGKRKNIYLNEVVSNNIALIRRVTIPSEDVARYLTWNTVPSKEVLEKETALFSKEILKYVIAHSSSYDKAVVDEVWLKDYLESLRSNTNMHKSTEYITVKTAIWNPYDNSGSFRMSDVAIKDLLKVRTKIIVYGDNSDDSALKLICNMLHTVYGDGYYENLTESFKTRYSVVKIAKANFKYFSRLPGAVHVKDFQKKYSKIISKLYYILKIKHLEHRLRNITNLAYLQFVGGVATEKIEKILRSSQALLEFITTPSRSGLTYHALEKSVTDYMENVEFVPDVFTENTKGKKESIVTHFNVMEEVLKKAPLIGYFEKYLNPENPQELMLAVEKYLTKLEILNNKLCTYTL